MLYTSLFEAQLVVAQVFELLWGLGQKLQLQFQARLNTELKSHLNSAAKGPSSMLHLAKFIAIPACNMSSSMLTATLCCN